MGGEASDGAQLGSGRLGGANGESYSTILDVEGNEQADTRDNGTDSTCNESFFFFFRNARHF